MKPTSPLVELQHEGDFAGVPDAAQFQAWVLQALQLAGHDGGELVIRIVDEDESRALNHEYRGKDKPTNVLSFPFEVPEGVPAEALPPLLGDLVICAPVVAAEATEQGKALHDHWAHMVIHGVLHLLGFDHIDDADAVIMESLEIRILAGLDIANPYDDAGHAPA
jgi:probable rRNA maturation factor